MTDKLEEIQTLIESEKGFVDKMIVAARNGDNIWKVVAELNDVHQKVLAELIPMAASIWEEKNKYV